MGRTHLFIDKERKACYLNFSLFMNKVPPGIEKKNTVGFSQCVMLVPDGRQKCLLILGSVHLT